MSSDSEHEHLPAPLPPAGPINKPVPVGQGSTPGMGAMGVAGIMFCPLVKGPCMKNACMFWVELHSDQGMVGHCAYYWNAIMLTELKNALIHLSQHIKEGVDAAARKEPVA